MRTLKKPVKKSNGPEVVRLRGVNISDTSNEMYSMHEPMLSMLRRALQPQKAGASSSSLFPE